MSTKKIVSHTHSSPHAHVSSSPEITTTEAAPLAATSSTSPPIDTATTTATSIVFIKPPPPLSTIPAVPEGNQNANGPDYVAALPKKLELAAMPDVLTELGRFTSYAAVFGKTAPPLEFVLQTATAAGQWSAMRVKSAAWDQYSRTQEGAAWTDFRQIMDMLRPALALAVQTDATIARQYPAMVRLFGAKSVIAQRGVRTRAANKAAKGLGKPPVRGKLAQKARRLKSAAATLAAAGHPVVLPAAPVPAVQAPEAPPQPAPTGAPPTPPAATPASNGAAHS